MGGVAAMEACLSEFWSPKPLKPGLARVCTLEWGRPKPMANQ